MLDKNKEKEGYFNELSRRLTEMISNDPRAVVSRPCISLINIS